MLQRKNVVGGTAENSCERERELQTRDVAIPLDRVDALSRDPDGIGQLLLGPSAFCAKLFDPVLYALRYVKLTFHVIVGSAQENVKPTCQIVVILSAAEREGSGRWHTRPPPRSLAVFAAQDDEVAYSPAAHHET
jgi:hypothetical protein